MLERTFQRNPGMLAAAVELHQSGALPAATQLIDLDMIARNARLTAEAAATHGLRVFAMTKQNGLNPFMTRVLLDAGIPSTCAVETLQAHRIHRYGFPLGNVGHIQNIPAAQVPAVVAMRPEFITVYTHRAAQRVSDAALELGIRQRVYVRVTNQAATGGAIVGADDGAFAGLVGGWTEDSCVEAVRALLDLPGIEIAGLTQFSAISYGETGDPSAIRPTDAFFTMLRGKELLEKRLGLEDLHLNVGGNANVGTFPTLARYGVTEVEPGVSLAGSGGFHAKQDMAEAPAQVVVTEVSHYWGDNVYTPVECSALYRICMTPSPCGRQWVTTWTLPGGPGSRTSITRWSTRTACLAEPIPCPRLVTRCSWCTTHRRLWSVDTPLPSVAYPVVHRVSKASSIRPATSSGRISTCFLWATHSNILRCCRQSTAGQQSLQLDPRIRAVQRQVDDNVEVGKVGRAQSVMLENQFPRFGMVEPSLA
ncbi:alanine racemase, N-terminal domain protein [Mycobacteroides abscessus MAB_091912_2446]|uniref:Alanine racemase, N-terminal domain protein n=1 Tax=Mycobacteroides abscessus MAB_091912_2446 TaxID=1335414 RepID=A0A829MNK8_9MYCO|nr:alanine racemase, N-terminal domain protein [Mycobacteroides abscessus MAB_091912_2446]